MKYKIGDVFFIHDSRWHNLVSTGIMAYSSIDSKPTDKIPYHCGLVYNKWGKLWEATWGEGVKITDPYEYYEKSYITIWYKRLKAPISDKKIADMQAWMTEQIGNKYDRSQILGIMLYGLLKFTPFWNRVKNKKHMFLDQEKEFICSEAVEGCFTEILDTDLCPQISSSNILPYDLNNSKLLELV